MKSQKDARLGDARPAQVDTVEEDDAALMRLVSSGDQRAFQRLMQKHLSRTVRLAGRMLGNELHAEDVAQDAFIRVWKHAPGWKDEAQTGAKFTTWFYKIVLRLCIDQKRKHRFVPIEDLPEPVDATPGAEARIETQEKACRVKRALEKLPERQRAALVLTFYEDLSNQESAQALGVSVKAVESLLVRGRRALKEELKEEKP